jgi:hypothetical protein
MGDVGASARRDRVEVLETILGIGEDGVSLIQQAQDHNTLPHVATRSCARRSGATGGGGRSPSPWPANKIRGGESIARSQLKQGGAKIGGHASYGGHFPAVQGFWFYVQAGLR